MNHFEFAFTSIDEIQKDALIALLADIGFTGFEENDESLKAFIGENNFNELEFNAVLKQMSVAAAKTIIPAKNWNANWESSYEPVMVDDFAVVRASFHSPVKNVQHEIIITPKMSFGTGHHATTYLMMQQMKGIDFSNTSALDFGTGTGILAILAEKLGAANITAIDNDEWSIENAAENIANNHCTKISLSQADIIPAEKKFDIILANINLNVITAAMPSIQNVAAENCIILLSGFLSTDEKAIAALIADAGFTLNSISAKNNWLCVQCTTN
jgi:ribosomal protein L11 methyltransferase